MFPNQAAQPLGNLQQPLLEGPFGIGANDPRGHHPVIPPIAIDYAVTGALRAAIDAEHPHGYCASASNSFSSISKLE